MLNQILIGQYIATDSFLHRIDPRTKLSAMLFLVLIIFGSQEPYQYALIGLSLFLAYAFSGIRLIHLYRGMRPILWFVYLTFFLHILLNKNGELLWQLGFIRVYSEGFWHGLTICFRLIALIFFSTLLTVTTAPIAMTEGIEALLKPFRKFLPVHEIALMLTISIRFIPTILRETERLIKAQAARGGSIARGSIFQRFQHIMPLIVPLFIMSFKRADELATAMEARGYQGSHGRSKYKQLSFSWRDYLLAALLFVWIGSTIYEYFL